MPASNKQIELFSRLIEDRDFGDKDTAILLTKFKEVSQASASQWIERALELPKRDTSGDPSTPPPF
jgi:hypothetical protein